MKLYMIEFGEPTIEKYGSSKGKPIFIVSESYESAIKIAEHHLEEFVTNEQKSVINVNGDLIIRDEIVISSIKLISDVVYGI